MPAAGVPLQGRRAVAVGGEGDAAGQGAALAERGRRRQARVVVTVKLPALPTVKVVLAALVMAGGSITVKVKTWVTAGA